MGEVVRLGDKLPCPYVYANGKKCTGHVVRVACYKAEVRWKHETERGWTFGWQPRSHYHLFCSEKNDHTGPQRQDDSRMKFHYEELPYNVRRLIDVTRVG